MNRSNRRSMSYPSGSSKQPDLKGLFSNIPGIYEHAMLDQHVPSAVSAVPAVHLFCCLH